MVTYFRLSLSGEEEPLGSVLGPASGFPRGLEMQIQRADLPGDDVVVKIAAA